MNILKRGALLVLLSCLFSVVSVSLAQAATNDECRYDCPPLPSVPEHDPVVQRDMTEPPSYKIESSQSGVYSPSLSPTYSKGFDWEGFIAVLTIVFWVMALIALTSIVVYEYIHDRMVYVRWCHENDDIYHVQYEGTWEDVREVVHMTAHSSSYSEALWYAKKTRRQLLKDKWQVVLYMSKERAQSMLTFVDEATKDREKVINSLLGQEAQA